jgi:hypothetical protein
MGVHGDEERDLALAYRLDQASGRQVAGVGEGRRQLRGAVAAAAIALAAEAFAHLVGGGFDAVVEFGEVDVEPVQNMLAQGCQDPERIMPRPLRPSRRRIGS